ncbi:MAG: glyceraldehyde-3-phosphate dehydrogenase [Deltaproteobacteria bacterium]|nr:glyceraldehyde-3-phosphate dehydrogenase [Deltaproteobacteria bacterium]
MRNARAITPAHGMLRNAAFCGLLAAAILLLPALPVAADTSLKELLTDPADGAFDMSRFIQTRTGFVPILAPITEPAVGYGAAGGLVFFHRKKAGTLADAVPAEEGRMTPPSLTVLAGFATENGSWGAFAGHRGVWKGDRIRYLGGLGYASLNLEFFGTGAQSSNISRDFEIQSVPFLQDISVRIPHSDFFAGLRYVFVDSDITFKPGRDIPGVTDRDWSGKSKIGGLTPYLEYDSTDNFFTPNKGVHAKASLAFFDEIFGGDYGYRELHAKAAGYWPVAPTFVAGLRVDGQFIDGDAPFYALPFVQLRGIPAMRYQGTDVVTLETEERWMLTRRWGLVGFAGIGKAADGLDDLLDAETAWNAGGGFRYLTAREFGLHMGVDVARGPEQWAVYFIFGNSWY